MSAITSTRKTVADCSRLLAAKKLSIAFAESATAGMLSLAFSQTPDSGTVLKGGIVCYDACLKEDLLMVPKTLIEKYTPESMEVTLAITRNLCDVMEADIYVGITGLTKPGGSETPEKPVGTMFTCIKTRHWEVIDRSGYQGDEEEILAQTITHLCNMLQMRYGTHQ